MRPHRSVRTLLLLFGLAAAVPMARPAAGQLPSPRLLGLLPSGGRAGEACTVTVRGEDLDAAEAILFSHPGIRGTLLTTDKPIWRRPSEASFTVTIAGDVPPGRYEARVRGRFGLSTSWPFFVGDLPVVQEQAGNDAPQKAMAIEPDTVLEGELAGGNRIDYYRFQGRPGQRFVLACETRPLHGQFDLMLEVTGPDGRPLASAFATKARDPVVPLVIRDAGEHVIRVNDRGFGNGGTPAARYRLTLGTRPHVVAVWPPVASTAASGTHRVLGFLLPGGRPLGDRGLEEVEAAVPKAQAIRQRSGDAFPLASLAAFGIDACTYRLPAPNGPSNPLPLAVAAALPVVEAEPNDPATAQRLTLPADVAGRFDGPADHDWFCFDAAEGDRLAVEVMAERLGAVADVAIVVEQVGRDPQGGEEIRTVAEQDDPLPRFSHPPCDLTTADPYVVFTAGRSGTYRVGVRNLAGTSYADDAAMYRLLVRPVAPDFRLLATSGDLGSNPGENADTTLAVPTLPRLRRGGRVPLVVQIHRRDGFDAPVTLGVEGLPPGVTCPPVTIAAGVNEGAVVLVAADDVAAWRGPIRVVGKARVAAEDRTRQAEWAAITWAKKGNTQSNSARLVDEMPLEVLAEPAALRIAVDRAAIGPVPQGGKVTIPFTIETPFEMQGPVRVEVRELVAAKPGPPYPKTPATSLAAGERAGEIEVAIPADAPPGTHAIHLVAQVSLLVARNAEAVAAADKAQADFAARRGALQEAADAARRVAEAAVVAVQAAARLPEGPDKKPAVANAEAVRKLADDANAKAKAALDAHLREEKPLEQWVNNVRKGNEAKPTDVFAASSTIDLTVTAPEPAAGATSARIGSLLPLLVQAATSLAVAAEPKEVDFGRDVLPILRSNCIACHTGVQPEADVVLESPETMLRPRDEGPVLVPGKPEESLLYLLAAHEKEPVMPPEDNDRNARRLSAAELAILRAWIAAGAPAGATGPRRIVWQPFPPGIRAIYAAAVSPDGTLAAAGSANRITLFDVATGRPVARLVDESLPQPSDGSPRNAAHVDAVRSLAFSPDGTRLASGAMRTVTIWKRSDAGPAAEPAWSVERRIGSVERADPFVDRVVALAFSPDGELLAAGGGEPTVSGAVTLVAADTGAVVRQIHVPHEDPVACLAFSPDGRRLATGANHVIGVYDLATGGGEQAFEEHTGRVLALDWKADGTALASVGSDGTACLWKTDPWEKYESVGLSGGAAVGVRYLGATDTFVVAEGDGRVRVRGAGSSGGVPEFKGAVDRVQSLAADAAGNVIVAGGMDGVLRVWRGTGGPPATLTDPVR